MKSMMRPITAKTRFKRSPKKHRIKSASKKLRNKMITRKSADRSLLNNKVNRSFMQRGTNISVSTKQLSREDQSNMPTQYMTMNNNFMSSTDTDKKNKRIYSAKPALNNSRRFMTNKFNSNDPYIVNLSPGNKIPETSYYKFTAQTVSSTNYNRKVDRYDESLTYQNKSVIYSKPNHASLTTYKINSKSTESSLSNLTQVQNKKALKEIDALEKIREKESEINEFTSLKHID